jgi:hypothetical protein
LIIVIKNRGQSYKIVYELTPYLFRRIALPVDPLSRPFGTHARPVISIVIQKHKAIMRGYEDWAGPYLIKSGSNKHKVTFLLHHYTRYNIPSRRKYRHIRLRHRLSRHVDGIRKRLRVGELHHCYLIGLKPLGYVDDPELLR